MSFDPDDSAGYLVNAAARLFAAALQARIGPLGLSPGQFPALLALWREDGLTQRELAARADVEQATMANTLIRMERDGLIRRAPHPEDGRSQRILLTPKARALEGAATDAAREVNETALAALSEEERRAFLRALRSASDALRATEVPAAPRRRGRSGA